MPASYKGVPIIYDDEREDADLITKYGWRRVAGSFTMKTDDMPEFLKEEIRKQINRKMEHQNNDIRQFLRQRIENDPNWMIC